MNGNSIGKNFKLTTCGESHGTMLCGIIDGIPPGIKINEKYIQKKINKRKPGISIYTTNRYEPDKIHIISGILNGLTTGTSIGLIIENLYFKSKDYNKIKRKYRPGHADYTYFKKFGIYDNKGGGRTSARETAIRVAAGAIAQKYLYDKFKIIIKGNITNIGNISFNIKTINNFNVNYKFKYIKELILYLKNKGNSIGAKITINVNNMPIGLGEPVFDKLDADISHALMSINAVKSIEIGDGIKVINKLGSENRDEITTKGFLSNNSGGILGGISNGQNLIIHFTLKPTASILIPGLTLNNKGKVIEIITKGRHDPCVGIRALPIAEAMIGIIILDHILRYKAQCGYIKNISN